VGRNPKQKPIGRRRRRAAGGYDCAVGADRRELVANNSRPWVPRGYTWSRRRPATRAARAGADHGGPRQGPAHARAAAHGGKGPGQGHRPNQWRPRSSARASCFTGAFRLVDAKGDERRAGRSPFKVRPLRFRLAAVLALCSSRASPDHSRDLGAGDALRRDARRRRSSRSVLPSARPARQQVVDACRAPSVASARGARRARQRELDRRVPSRVSPAIAASSSCAA